LFSFLFFPFYFCIGISIPKSGALGRHLLRCGATSLSAGFFIIFKDF